MPGKLTEIYHFKVELSKFYQPNFRDFEVASFQLVTSCSRMVKKPAFDGMTTQCRRCQNAGIHFPVNKYGSGFP